VVDLRVVDIRRLQASRIMTTPEEAGLLSHASQDTALYRKIKVCSVTESICTCFDVNSSHTHGKYFEILYTLPFDIFLVHYKVTFDTCKQGELYFLKDLESLALCFFCMYVYTHTRVRVLLNIYVMFFVSVRALCVQVCQYVHLPAHIRLL